MMRTEKEVKEAFDRLLTMNLGPEDDPRIPVIYGDLRTLWWVLGHEE
jgi:hypothetical protein